MDWRIIAANTPTNIVYSIKEKKWLIQVGEKIIERKYLPFTKMINTGTVRATIGITTPPIPTITVKIYNKFELKSNNFDHKMIIKNDNNEIFKWMYTCKRLSTDPPSHHFEVIVTSPTKTKAVTGIAWLDEEPDTTPTPTTFTPKSQPITISGAKIDGAPIKSPNNITDLKPGWTEKITIPNSKSTEIITTGFHPCHHINNNNITILPFYGVIPDWGNPLRKDISLIT